MQSKKRKLVDTLQLPALAAEALQTLMDAEESYRQQRVSCENVLGFDSKGVRINCGHCGTSIADLHRACANPECPDPETFCIGCSNERCPKCPGRDMDIHDSSVSGQTGQLHGFVERARHFCSHHHAAAMHAAEEQRAAVEGKSPDVCSFASSAIAIFRGCTGGSILWQTLDITDGGVRHSFGQVSSIAPLSMCRKSQAVASRVSEGRVLQCRRWSLREMSSCPQRTQTGPACAGERLWWQVRRAPIHTGSARRFGPCTEPTGGDPFLPQNFRRPFSEKRRQF